MLRYTAKLIFLSLSIALLASGCADAIVSDCGDPLPDPVRARFGDIEQRVFAQSCALAGCHTGSSPASGLNLTPGQAYAQLVGVTSLNDPSLARVQAGSSAQSLIIKLLRRERSPAMPPAGPIESAVIDSIAAWIDAGALRN
jgi:hypothetical protein